MIGSREGDVILEKASEFSSEGRGELWPSVRDYFRVEAESRENVGKEKLGYSFGVNVFCTGAINYPLREPMVYHDHD